MGAFTTMEANEGRSSRISLNVSYTFGGSGAKVEPCTLALATSHLDADTIAANGNRRVAAGVR